MRVRYLRRGGAERQLSGEPSAKHLVVANPSDVSLAALLRPGADDETKQMPVRWRQARLFHSLSQISPLVAPRTSLAFGALTAGYQVVVLQLSHLVSCTFSEWQGPVDFGLPAPSRSTDITVLAPLVWYNFLPSVAAR